MQNVQSRLLKQKQKIEDDPAHAKPQVINDKLIEQYLVNYHKDN